MKGFFSVDYKDNKKRLDCRFLFKSIGRVDAADLSGALKESIRKITYPDVVVIVITPSEKDDILELINSNRSVIEALKRASSNITVALSVLSANGNFGNLQFLANEREGLFFSDCAASAIYTSGLSQLFADCNVLMRAPPGFTFLKPSGNRSTYFLRAEEAIFETERVHFLACSLLPFISEREKTSSTIHTIFIDTMAIASIAYVLRDLYSELYGILAKPRVVSFHSYEGMKEIRSPYPGESMCIISASSSMAMQRDWVAHTKCGQNEIVTLVTLSGAVDENLALHRLPQRHAELSSRPGELLKDLRIVGEKFSPEEIPPKEVILTEKAHKLKRWSKSAHRYSESGIVCAHINSPGSQGVRRIHIDGDVLVKQNFVVEQLRNVISQKVPLFVKAIIYQSDPSSKKMSNICADIIQKAIGIEVMQISADDLTPSKIKDGEGVLIVAAVISRGEGLLSISRDLRELHKGPRHYVVGFQLAEKWSDRARLESNLTFSRDEYSYGVSILESLAIGNAGLDMKNAEIEVFENVPTKHIPPEISRRLDCIKKSVGDTGGAFLPKVTDVDSRLELRKTFAFWDAGYRLDVHHSSTVLLTIAAILQNAREIGVEEEDSKRLCSDAFQQVLLDPENFSRFNDGIVQSALLRAAFESELDYSSCPDASGRMKSLLLGIFSASHRPQGEAALEFALALASRKIRLEIGDQKSLLDEVSASINGSDQKVLLLKQILKTVGVDRPDQIPF